MRNKVQRLARSQRGQSMVEYGVGLALVAALGFAVFQTLGQKTNTQFATHPLNALIGNQPGPPAPPSQIPAVPLPPGSPGPAPSTVPMPSN